MEPDNIICRVPLFTAAAVVARKIARVLGEPIPLHEQEITVTASLGVAEVDAQRQARSALRDSLEESATILGDRLRHGRLQPALDAEADHRAEMFLQPPARVSWRDAGKAPHLGGVDEADQRERGEGLQRDRASAAPLRRISTYLTVVITSIKLTYVSFMDVCRINDI